MGAVGRTVFILFVLLLGIWTGSGFHDTVATNSGWYADPVAYANHPPLPEAINPWPISTMLLLLATLAAAVALWRHRGPGRREGLIAVAGTALVLVATLAWFVPKLGVMAGGTLSDAELVSLARIWISLNVARLLLLIGLFYYALLALTRLAPARREEG